MGRSAGGDGGGAETNMHHICVHYLRVYIYMKRENHRLVETEPSPEPLQVTHGGIDTTASLFLLLFQVSVGSSSVPLPPLHTCWLTVTWKKKTNKKTGQFPSSFCLHRRIWRSLTPMTSPSSLIRAHYSSLHLFFSHLIQGSVGWWTSVTRRGVTGGVTCCCCARTDLPNDMRHIQSHYTRVGGIRRPEQKGVWCNCVDLLKSSKLFSGSAHHYNFAPWSLLLQWLFHQKCQMNDHGSLF